MSNHHHEPWQFTAEFWDDRYRTGETTWSGNPNPRLVEHVAALAPGTALDAGSGDGSDAIWLAERGWQVTGTDVSQVALDLAAGRAADAGIQDRITWQQADLLTWQPPEQSFDLVSAQFLHLPADALADVHRRLAAAVRPGGTLLVVLHHVSDLDTTVERWDEPSMFPAPEEVAADLGEGWDVHRESLPREAPDHEGHSVTIHDTVVRAVRRGAAQGSNR